MKAESLAFFGGHLETNRTFMDLMVVKVTFATPRLAKHLASLPKEGLAKYDLSAVPERGLLTYVSVLTIGGDEASMVTRGLFVLHDLLRSG